MKKIFSAADIMLPDFISVSSKAEKWGVVACDQYTSEPEYWENVSAAVGTSPSTLHIILPEAYLSMDTSERLADIAGHMECYDAKILKTYYNSLILVRRRVSNGKIRTGIVGKVDLEAYDYSADSNSPVRATEGTVLERIPPRVAVRRNASLELPHIMILIDDAQRKIIESVAKTVSDEQKIYDFDLLFGDHVEGYLLSELQITGLLDDLEEHFAGKKICFAVGDGNHSLASAKARYEEIKTEIGEERAKQHPLRYALCEVVNLHDESIEFEPIYRLVKTNNVEKVLCSLKSYVSDCGTGTQSVECIYGNNRTVLSLGRGTHTLTVGTLQNFLDYYNANVESIEIDYIHGIDSIEKLSSKDGVVGFIFEGMQKSELFDSVEKDGALPRKTFSMGEAKDKRFYIECRKISE